MKALDLHLSLALNNHGAKLSQAFGCDVLAYVGDIDDGSIPLYKEVIERLDDERKLAPSGFNADRLVIVLHTNGGIVEVVEKLVSITRSKYDVVDFLVPEHAMSAGTIWCMSGDSIFMDYASSLGPIDPQVRSSNGRFIPALGYIEKKAELDDKSNMGVLTDVDMVLLTKMDLAELYRYEQARDLSISLLRNWLIKYKFKNWTTHRTTNPGANVTQVEKEQRARDIATDLSNNARWHSHGRYIDMQSLISDLRLEIEDFSTLPGVKEHARMYIGLLVDHMEREQEYQIVHSPCRLSKW